MRPMTDSHETQGNAADIQPVQRTGAPKSKRWYAVAAGVLVVVAGGTVAAVAGDGGGRGSGNAAAAPSTATAAIIRGDVVDTESVDGKLTYSDSRAITIAKSGTVTWVPAEGATMIRGKPLLKVDTKPVVLMYGSLPLYRPLYDGVGDGTDVRQLERNLKALGYGDAMTVDRHFTTATAHAVEDWQDDMGLPETGRIDASQVVFQPGAVRVTDVKAGKGQRAGGGPALTVSDTKSIVHVDLDAGKQQLADKGAAVTVELPNGKRVGGHITDVGTVARKSQSSQSSDSGDDTSTIDVDITLDQKDTGRLDDAPVTVDLESARAKNVLSVPIEALLALREGGFGVEVVEGDTSHIVPVRIGTFGGGRVEITGAGLGEGMKVGVARS
jgi:peptidoglycan hydrolase-like protein with peptidoglycan-binding domain